MADLNAPPRQGPSPHASIRGARLTPLDSSVISRAAGFVRRMVGLGVEGERLRQADLARRTEPTLTATPAEARERPVVPSQVVRTDMTPGTAGDGYFGPGQPMQPLAPHSEVAGRQFDFPAGYNLSVTPRRYEGINFETLRGLATYDLIRLAIETRKDQLARVKWSILPKKPPGQRHNTKADDTCRKLEQFFRKPDGVRNWTEWVRAIAEDSMVLDGVALYRRRALDGSAYALEAVDPATISLLIDRTGRRPLHPAPAYQQIIKGVPAAEFTSKELTYSVRNPRTNRIYGHSPVEQVVTYVNIGLRRMAGQLNHYTEGNIPEALMQAPEGWTGEQIQEMQAYWDTVMENPAQRRRMKFVPPGMNYWPIHGEGGAQLMDPFDEWLARIICYAFSLPPLPFVKMQNRATSETAYETALEEGLEPTLDWLKALLDQEIAEFHCEPNYELIWDDIRKLDPSEKHGMDHQDVQRGFKSIDEVRAERGDEPLGLPHIVWGVGPIGFMSIGAIKKAIEQGLDMPPEQMPMDGMGLPPGADPLAGADPGVMQQLGLGGPQQGGMAPDQNGGPPMMLAGPRTAPVGGPEEGGEEDEDGSGETPFAQQSSPPVSFGAMMRSVRADPRASKTLRRFEQRLQGRTR